MAEGTHVTYLFDPLCGWCYGAAPVIRAIAAMPEFRLQLAPVGLFTGAASRPLDDTFAAHIAVSDQRITRLTGQPFSDEYRRKVLADRERWIESGPATLALTAVVLGRPERELDALSAIQSARYVGGWDITDTNVLAEILRGLDLAAAADRLIDPDEALVVANRDRVEAARREMQRFAIDGVPALVVGAGRNRRLVRASGLYGGLEDLLAGLRAA